MSITGTCDLSNCYCTFRKADYNQLGAQGQGIGPSASGLLNFVMSIFWLRIALGFYGVGLLYALVAITRTSDLLNRVVLHASYLGMIFHFVSLTEGVLLTGHLRRADEIGEENGRDLALLTPRLVRGARATARAESSSGRKRRSAARAGRHVRILPRSHGHHLRTDPTP